MGRTWSCVSKQGSEPFQAAAGPVTFTAIRTKDDFSSEDRARVISFRGPVLFDVQADPGQTNLTVIEGCVEAKSESKEASVNPGQQLLCPDGHLGDPKPVENLASATSWLNEILILKGRDNPELNRRIDDLLAQIGATKIDFMYEDEIRGLGDHCVVPLVRYIESDRSSGEEAKRATAAKIVSDVAPPWAIPELLHLLNDHNGDVRASAATALQRLTGQNLGRSPQAWRDDSPLLCEPTEQAWQQWWQNNQDKFPGASTQPIVIVKKPQLMQKG
jgi:hypothetical protein